MRVRQGKGFEMEGLNLQGIHGGDIVDDLEAAVNL